MDLIQFMKDDLGYCTVPQVAGITSQQIADQVCTRPDLYFRFWSHVIGRPGALTPVELTSMALEIIDRQPALRDLTCSRVPAALDLLTGIRAWVSANGGPTDSIASLFRLYNLKWYAIKAPRTAKERATEKMADAIHELGLAVGRESWSRLRLIPECVAKAVHFDPDNNSRFRDELSDQLPIARVDAGRRSAFLTANNIQV